MNTNARIRRGTVEDLQAILDLIVELAIYEKAEHEVENSTEQMKLDGFGERPVFDFFVVEENEMIVGTAIYYFRYSTWKGKALYLEDLVVSEKHRGKGYGKALLDAIVKQAKSDNCKQVRWQVLDWNEPAINFYNSIGADLDAEWINCTLDAQQIANY